MPKFFAVWVIRWLCASASFLLLNNLHAQALSNAYTLPEKDARLAPPKTLDTPRAFPAISSQADWTLRAREIREQVLFSCGLIPLPPKIALHPQSRGKIERDGYSIENVAIETYPGFFLAGNLYRPLGQGAGPFPGVLNPHGHWDQGRLTDTEEESMPARCIHLARHGVIVFAIDMVGYNDTIQIPQHREFALDPKWQLWNINLMGLQTWNCLRALDYLAALPEVDKTRLGCTGASGGGTQTFMLGAIDDRLKVQAPIVMVSSTMQGGCLCENAPGLRVEYSNMELAAAAAPRPQLLVAATGDWTKMTLTVEGPAIAKIYDLFQASNQFHYVRHDFKHNYNQTTRESVYAWFNQWLLPQPKDDFLQEKPHAKEAAETLRLWPEGKLPTNAVSGDQLIQNLSRLAQNRFDRLWPTNREMRRPFREAYQPIWKHTFQFQFPNRTNLVAQTNDTKTFGGRVFTEVAFGRGKRGDRVAATLVTSTTTNRKEVIILVNPAGRQANFKAPGELRGTAEALAAKNFPVLLVDVFMTGDQADPKLAAQRNYFTNFFTTYNRTDAQERMQDIVTASAFARFNLGARRLIFCGTGRAGLWMLTAAPLADIVAADCAQTDTSSDKELLSQDLFVPGFRRLGGFDGILAITSPKPVLLHNTGNVFPAERIKNHFHATTLPKYFLASDKLLPDAELASWIEVQARW